MRNIIIVAAIIIIACAIGLYGAGQVNDCRANNCTVCMCDMGLSSSGLGSSPDPILCYVARLSVPCNTTKNLNFT